MFLKTVFSGKYIQGEGVLAQPAKAGVRKVKPLLGPSDPMSCCLNLSAGLSERDITGKASVMNP
jgi:hypothetical protein